MSSNPYTPVSIMPYLQASGGAGPLTLQDRGDVIQEVETYQAVAPIERVTNTTPIVIETTAPHYFQNALKVIINGTGVAGANNGAVPWSITVLTATTFSLTGSTASGAAGAGGNAISVEQGTLGKLIDAVDILRLTLGFTPGVIYNASSVAPRLTTGRRILQRPRVVLSDANHLIDTSEGDVFELSSAPAAIRTIRLRMTSDPPALIGETITIVVGGALATGQFYLIKREDSLLTIAEFYGNALGDEAPAATFEFAIPVFNVVSASNATPIAITTQEAHVFVTGDAVTIAGSSDAGANGTFTVTRTGAATFTLDGTTADGGGTGGTATGEQGTYRLGQNSGGGSAGGVLAGPGA